MSGGGASGDRSAPVRSSGDRTVPVRSTGDRVAAGDRTVLGDRTASDGSAVSHGRTVSGDRTASDGRTASDPPGGPGPGGRRAPEPPAGPGDRPPGSGPSGRTPVDRTATGAPPGNSGAGSGSGGHPGPGRGEVVSGSGPGEVVGGPGPGEGPGPGTGTAPGPRPAPEDDPGPEPGAVTLVVPTFNESANVRELLRRIADSVSPVLPCEVVFVDDSTDDTPEVIGKAAPDCPFPVVVLHRDEPTGGLGGAVVEGIRAATSPWVVVLDGDLQHPPHLVPELVAAGERTGAPLVVASRYAPGGSRAGLAGGRRVAVSRAATWLTKALFPRTLSGVSDPMSGFFAVRRSAVPTEVLKPLGYKILLELAVRARPRAVTEVPFAFQERYAGESKSTAREGLRFLRHLLGLRTAAPLARMIAFGLIGLTGFLPNLAALHALTSAGMHYLTAEIVANQAGVAWNFLLIELLLFRDRRRHRHWADRTVRFALLANADLVLRIPLIALFVRQWDMAVVPATALALVTTFVLRFAGTEALVYLPRRRRTRRDDGAGTDDGPVPVTGPAPATGGASARGTGPAAPGAVSHPDGPAPAQGTSRTG